LFRGNGGFYVFAAGNFVGIDLSFFGFGADHDSEKRRIISTRLRSLRDLCRQAAGAPF
jgi:hypothetical protein